MQFILLVLREGSLNKKIFLFTATIFLSCSSFCFTDNTTLPSMQEQYSSGYWLPISSNNKLTVIGVSNQMMRRQDEITSAKEDAARKVAMYYGIQGSLEMTNRTGSGLLDYAHSSNIDLAYEADYERFIDQLTYDPQEDVLRTSEGIFVRFQHNTNVMNISYNARLNNDRPSWIRNQDMPVIEGFVTAVGFSRNQRRLKDTIFKSAENAVIRMIEDLYTTVNTREVSVTGQGSSSVIHARSEGRLNNFQVIEFWIEPETRYVYTLAIARAGE